MNVPGTKTLDDIRAHARAIERGSGIYETQMLCKLVIGLADQIEALTPKNVKRPPAKPPRALAVHCGDKSLRCQGDDACQCPCAGCCAAVAPPTGSTAEGSGNG